MKKIVLLSLVSFGFVYPAVDSIVIQPGPGEAKDCQIVNTVDGMGGSWGHYNNGKTPCMSAGAYDDNTVCRSLIEFSMPADIDPESILKAEIILSTDQWKDGDTNPPCPISVYQMLRSWKQGKGSGGCDDKVANSAYIDGATGIERFWGGGIQDEPVTWNAPNVGTDDVDAKSSPEATVFKKKQDASPWVFDITALCKQWIRESVPNHGVLVKNLLEFGSDGKYIGYPIFCTGETTTSPEKRPKLRIVYMKLEANKQMVAHLTFASAVAGLYLDETGNGNDAVARGFGLARVAGIRDSAISLNGKSHLRIKNAASLNMPAELTIECWINVKPTDSAIRGPGRIIARKNKSFGIGIGPDKKVGFWIHDKTGWQGSWSFSRQSIQPSRWNHIAGLWNGRMMTVFINGVEDSASMPAGGVIAENTSDVYIGAFAESDSAKFEGTIDELKLYNYALPPAAVLARYSSLKPPDTAPITVSKQVASRRRPSRPSRLARPSQPPRLARFPVHSFQLEIKDLLHVAPWQGSVICYKVHCNDNNAIRIGLGAYGNELQKYDSAVDSSTIQDAEEKSNLNGNVCLTYIRYCYNKDNLNAYCGLGPQFQYQYVYSKRLDEIQETVRSNLFGAGFTGIFGLEWLFNKHFSLFTEYNITGIYQQHELKSSASPYLTIQRIWNFNYNSYFLGMSVYL